MKSRGQGKKKLAEGSERRFLTIASSLYKIRKI